MHLFERSARADSPMSMSSVMTLYILSRRWNLDAKSDYSFKELLTPLSQTLFFFTEDVTQEAKIDTSDAIIFLRSCDLHAIKRLDDIYLNNKFEDPFYKKVREHVKFALIGLF
jgi:hypothetical protein